MKDDTMILRAARFTSSIVLVHLLLTAGLAPGRAVAAEDARALSGIDVGEWVEASVRPDARGGWMTSELDVKGAGQPNAGSLTGPLHRAPDGSLSLLGLPLVLGAQTAVKDTSGENVPLETIPNGALVEAHLLREGNRFTVKKLRARAPDENLEIEGPVEAVSLVGPPTVRILGFEIEVDEDVRIRNLHKRPRFIRLVDDDDLLPSSLVAVGPFLVGGTATLEVRHESNYDLNERNARDLTNSDPSGRVEVSGKFSEGVRLFAKGGYRGRVILQDERGTKKGYGEWDLGEAYLLFLGVGRPEIALQIGRQDFDEKREWLYDENLDAVRLHLLGDRLWGEISASTRFGQDSPPLASTWNTMASVGVSPAPDLSLGMYAIHRAPREGRTDARLTWLGARLLSAKWGRVRGWGEATILRGDEAGLSVRANGVHASASVLLSRRGRVMANVAWARGSGDVDFSDGTDGNFRQTGFHDNNDRFGGVTSFRYYGELAQPGLSNLAVFTLGLGARPTRSTSVDLLLHRFRQVEAAPFLGESDLEARPTGLDDDLGREVDLVVGVRALRMIKIEYVLAGFWAGKAFPRDTERATTSRFQVDVGF